MPESLVWKKTGLMFGDWSQGPNSDSIFEFSSSLPISDRVQNNGSLYLHSFLVREGKSPDPDAGKAMFSKKWTAYKKQRLNKFMKRKYKKTSNLLTGATDKTEEEQAKAELGLTEIISVSPSSAFACSSSVLSVAPVSRLDVFLYFLFMNLFSLCFL